MNKIQGSNHAEPDAMPNDPDELLEWGKRVTGNSDGSDDNWPKVANTKTPIVSLIENGRLKTSVPIIMTSEKHESESTFNGDYMRSMVRDSANKLHADSQLHSHNASPEAEIIVIAIAIVVTAILFFQFL